MATTQDLKRFESFPMAEVRDRKHVFHGTEPSYTIMGACRMPQWYEGNIGLIDPTPVHALTMQTCCEAVDARFQARFPEHRCTEGCSEWRPFNPTAK
jgi:hypothetical protein